MRSAPVFTRRLRESPAADQFRGMAVTEGAATHPG